MEEKNNKKLIIISSIVVLVIILVLLILEFGFHVFSGMIKNNIGNTDGNIRNYGYAAYEGNKMYFVTPDDTSTKTRINKANLDGSNSIIIYETEYDILSLNVYHDKLYFIAMVTNDDAKDYSESLLDSENEIDYIDNRICSLNIDGTDLKVLNDNEFSNDDYQVFVTNNNVYYIGEDYNIYSMGIDGSNKKAISTNKTGFLAISEKYIVYNDYPAKQKAEIANNKTVDNPEYVTYIMQLDGSNIREIDGSRLYSVNIVGEYIYYTDADKNICKIRVDGKEKQVIVQTNAYNMNATKNKIYYLNYKDENNQDYTVCIYRCNLDGSNNENIKQLEKYSQFLDIINDKPFYMDSIDSQGRIYLLDPNSKKETQLYSIKYSTINGDTNSDDSSSPKEYSIDDIVKNDDDFDHYD